MTKDVKDNVFASVPDANGRFGDYGGNFVAETLMSALAFGLIVITGLANVTYIILRTRSERWMK